MSMGTEPAIDYVRCGVWGMLYAGDACIASRSPQRLANIMEIIKEVCQVFAMYVAAKKTKTICMPSPRKPQTMVRVEGAGQIYKNVQPFTYLGSAAIETWDIFVEITRWTRAF